MTYICPMHPEVTSDKPARCPKCGMKLIVEGKQQTMNHDIHIEKITWKSYLPLIVVIGLILTTALTISLADYLAYSFSVTSFISYFMIGFFIVFSGFKLIDLSGFAQGYSTYDLLAKKWFSYGYIYPFIELAFGLGMIVFSQSSLLLLVEIIVMVFSGAGVSIKLLRKERFQCACLGTFLKVPLTKITLVEDFGMAILALVMLLFR